MFLAFSAPASRSTITAVDSHCYNICYVSIIGLLVTCDQQPDFEQLLNWTLPQNSRSNVTYVTPVTVNCIYCTPDDGCGDRQTHVEISCNKTKILLLHLVWYLYTYVENDARNHEPKMDLKVISPEGVDGNKTG
jgi:hypothetical protein